MSGTKGEPHCPRSARNIQRSCRGEDIPVKSIERTLENNSGAQISGMLYVDISRVLRVLLVELVAGGRRLLWRAFDVEGGSKTA